VLVVRNGFVSLLIWGICFVYRGSLTWTKYRRTEAASMHDSKTHGGSTHNSMQANTGSYRSRNRAEKRSNTAVSSPETQRKYSQRRMRLRELASSVASPWRSAYGGSDRSRRQLDAGDHMK
jgi:hypothetical protein